MLIERNQIPIMKPAAGSGVSLLIALNPGNWMSGKAASLYSSMSLPTLFGSVTVFSLAATVVLALLVRPTVKLMGGVK